GTPYSQTGANDGPPATVLKSPPSGPGGRVPPCSTQTGGDTGHEDARLTGTTARDATECDRDARDAAPTKSNGPALLPARHGRIARASVRVRRRRLSRLARLDGRRRGHRRLGAALQRLLEYVVHAEHGHELERVAHLLGHLRQVLLIAVRNQDRL